MLLGDQLIGNARLALFELVKNAYDADSTKVTVELKKLGTDEARIVVRDDGCGMSFEDIRDIWLVPGADHKLKAKHALQRSERGRLPLGEKGLGRFAVHKLGERITLVTRKKGEMTESLVRINWSEQASKPFLSDTSVEIMRREPQIFLGDSHGTKVTMKDLREQDWSRGELRRLYRQVTSICSPFDGPADFAVDLTAPGRDDDLKGIPSYEDILERALWRFKFEVDANGLFSWNYQFVNGLKNVQLEGRNAEAAQLRLLLPGRQRDILGDSSVKRESKVILDADFLVGIGPIKGEFYVFDRDKEVLARMPETQLIRTFLDESGGIRVYRDGVRVYNYGERGDDWLGLDLRRVNSPDRRISRNIVVGALHLDQATSTALQEKTNREGFVDTDALNRFKNVVLAALTTFESERKLDKDRLRIVMGKAPQARRPVQSDIEALRQLAESRGLLAEFEPTIRRIESELVSFQETMLRAGFSGLGLAVVFHEVERGVRGLKDGLVKGTPVESLIEQASSLTKLFDGFAGLLKRNERVDLSAKSLIRQARDLNILRFQFHKVQLVCPFLDEDVPDFTVSASHSLLLGVLNNILDNSFYWLRVRYPEVRGEAPLEQRAVFIDAARMPDGSCAIVVADNGPGFTDTPESLVQPFVTRKPDGMGLGLYYVNLVMELSGGQALFGDTDIFDVPPAFDGATITMTFGGPVRKGT